MKKVVKKARRDKAQVLNVKKLRKKLSLFANNYIIDMYLRGDVDSVTIDEILDEFIVEEFGATKGKEQLAALLYEKMNSVLRAAIKNARKEGVPSVPVNYSYFELTYEDIEMIYSDEDAKPYVAGCGRGNMAFGCRLCIDSENIDPFWIAYHQHVANTSNGVLDSAKKFVDAGNNKKLVGYSSNSKLVKETRGAKAIPAPTVN